MPDQSTAPPPSHIIHPAILETHCHELSLVGEEIDTPEGLTEPHHVHVNSTYLPCSQQPYEVGIIIILTVQEKPGLQHMNDLYEVTQLVSCLGRTQTQSPGSRMGMQSHRISDPGSVPAAALSFRVTDPFVGLLF